MMEYMVEATEAERRAELAKCRLAREATAGTGRSSWLRRIMGGRAQARARRERSAASAAGHSLSISE
jgi:hypothetical protein